MINGIGRDADESEKPARFYNTPKANAITVHVGDVLDGVQVTAISGRGIGGKIIISHSLLPNDYRWRGQEGEK